MEKDNEESLGLEIDPRARGKASRDYKNGAQAMAQEEWLGEPPEYDRFDEELKADVVVVGAGISGIAAARSAVENGAKSVIIFEKCRSIQARSGDFAVIGSKVSEDHWGRSGLDIKERLIANLVKESHNRADLKTIRFWADNCGAAFDWYIEGSPDMTVLDYTAQPVPKGVKKWLLPARYPLPEGYNEQEDDILNFQITCRIRPSHLHVLRGNLEIAQSKGDVRLLCSTPAKKLLVDSDGRVTGVVAESFAGKVYRAEASRGVILATGDYGGDLDMLYHYCPWVRKNPFVYTSIDENGMFSNTGDGHKMGMWVGAKMEDGPHAASPHNMGGPVGVAAFLQLDINGHRFMNEDCDAQRVDNRIVRLPGATSWQIFDANWPKHIPHMSPTHGCACYVLEEEDIQSGKVSSTVDVGEGFATQKGIERSIRAGVTYRADSLEELFDLIGLPREEAMESIRRYNKMAEEGRDTDFNKNPRRLFPISIPPFYAVKFVPAPLFGSYAGLESDWQCRCYNTDFKVIPGLYLAGNVQGNRIAVEYPTAAPGMSHSMALTFGRQAGKCAALGL